MKLITVLPVHARDRGAETWWKSFTTGKSAEKLGGVPHDTYGMTSLSVRQYVVGIYKQLGLREKDITKVQTGGPGKSSSVPVFRGGLIIDLDGDLGSSMFDPRSSRRDLCLIDMLQTRFFSALTRLSPLSMAAVFSPTQLVSIAKNLFDWPSSGSLWATLISPSWAKMGTS